MKYSKNFKGKIIKINSAHFSGNIFYIFKSFLLLLIGFLQSMYYLFYFKPIHCIGFGSYASFMPLIVATILKLFKITSVHLHEQNSIVGKVNLFFLPFANNLFLNFENVNNLDNKRIDKIYYVGLPTNEKYIFLDRSISSLSEKTNIQIFIYGGSQGSINLNNTLIKLLKNLPDVYFKKIKLIMQCPDDQKKYIENELNNIGVDYKLKNFFEDINEIINSSDILVSRSGAGTINDIILSQIPSILVPIPHSIYNHQYYNAKLLFDKNATELIEEKDFNSDKSYRKFKELIDNIDRRVIFINNLKSFKKLDANRLIFKKIGL